MGVYSKWKNLPLGEHLVTCDRHGGLMPASQIRMERTQEGGTTYAVCETCWDRVQPQQYVRGVKENLKPDLPIRPERDLVFEAFCTESAVVGIAIAGCSKVGVTGDEAVLPNPATDDSDFLAANSVDLN